MIVETQPGNMPIIISSGLFPGISIHGNYCKELEDVLVYARLNGYTIPDKYVLDALNVWISEMKDSGIWYKRDYIYNFRVNAKHFNYADSSANVPMDSGGFCNINYKNPNRFEIIPKLVQTGRIRFVNKKGWWSNPSGGQAGHVAYLDPGFTTADMVYGSRNSNHFVVWRDDETPAGPNNSIIIQLSTGTGGGAVRTMISFIAAGTSVSYGSYQNILSSYVTNDKKGYWLVNRSTSTEVKLFYNGQNVDTKTVSSNGFPNAFHFFLPQGSINSNQEISFASCGSALSDQEIIDDYDIWMNYYNKVKR